MVDGFSKDAAAGDLSKFGDPGQVYSWWRGQYRRAHVGILTGRGPAPLVVIDLDVRKEDTRLPDAFAGVQHGAEVLESRMPSGEEWPVTYTVATPSGGIHLYFQMPEGEPIGCTTGVHGRGAIGPLVDVRGLGGVIIAAGSYSSAQGIPYYRTSPAGLGPQPVPGWLLEILRAPAPVPARRPASVRTLPTGDRAERYAAAALQGAADDVAQAPEGERNRRLFAAARRLGELHTTAPAVLAERTVEEELLAAARAAGLDDRSAGRTIRSGWARGTAGHGAGAA